MPVLIRQVSSCGGWYEDTLGKMQENVFLVYLPVHGYLSHTPPAQGSESITEEGAKIAEEVEEE